MRFWRHSRKIEATKMKSRFDTRFNNNAQFNKKADISIPTLLLMILAVVTVFLILVLLVAPQLFGIGELLGFQQSQLKKDSDGDKVVDRVDECPCTYGDLNYDGCPNTFTPELVKADQQKYNSDTGCGVLEVGASSGTSPGVINLPEVTIPREDGVPSPEVSAGASKVYRSVEIFGDDDWSADPQDAIVMTACTGWVGQDCPAADNSCDAGDFSYQKINEGCWFMASEDDGTVNECGQAKVDDGTVISLKDYKDLDIDVTNQYSSVDDDEDPKNLFKWKWKSRPDYGSLLCNKGFWYGCKGINEGREFPESVNGQNYHCVGSEWVK